MCGANTFAGRAHADGNDKDLPTTSQRKLKRREQPQQPGGSGAVDVAGRQKNQKSVYGNALDARAKKVSDLT